MFPASTKSIIFCTAALNSKFSMFSPAFLYVSFIKFSISLSIFPSGISSKSLKFNVLFTKFPNLFRISVLWTVLKSSIVKFVSFLSGPFDIKWYLIESESYKLHASNAVIPIPLLFENFWSLKFKYSADTIVSTKW